MIIDTRDVRAHLKAYWEATNTDDADVAAQALVDDVKALQAENARLWAVAAAAQGLRDHVKALRNVPTLKIGQAPPWHLIDEAKRLNAVLDAALAALAAAPGTAPTDGQGAGEVR